MQMPSPYKMTLNLNILNHLGLNLYSNIPAVISEVVANAWDADAEKVGIEIDQTGDRVIITDNGCGMTLEEINAKYLNIGYRRRETPDGAITSKWHRNVMGRKGIGKLSLFSIAKTIEVHTVKDGRKHGLRMILDDIKKKIEEAGDSVYSPEPVKNNEIKIAIGTRIIITDLKKNLRNTEKALRRRLARRFSIIGDKRHFNVKVNDSPITVADRDYFHKIQYLWSYGDATEYVKHCNDDVEHKEREGAINSYSISGWIGTVARAGDLKDEYDDNLNKIVIMVRGKLAQEDILEDFNEGGVYSKYLIGEINADFLDIDEEADIATSSRQKIIEDDPRYVTLRTFIGQELKNIQNTWTELRNAEGARKAFEIPAIKEWFDTLSRGSKKRAESLFGKINQLTVDKDDERKMLFKHGVLAFESLRYRENLEALDSITPDNIKALTAIFNDLV